MFSPVYFVLLAVHLAVIAEVLPAVLHPFTKLSLVTALLVFVGTQWRRFAAYRGWKLLTAGLVLSLLGDGLLLGEDESWFTGGLVAFLLAHVCYAICFKEAREDNHEIPVAQKYLLITLGMVMVGIAVLLFLHKSLESMLAPVALYILVITVMAVRAINRFRKASERSYGLVLLGAVLFMVSDTLLATHTFKGEMDWAALAIMATYGMAQWGIALGIHAFYDANQA